jgi:hypothetical protein
MRVMRNGSIASSCGFPQLAVDRLGVHTIAVRSLEQCSHDANAVARHLVALTTYLGHAHVTDTYWYLQATPILMAQIAAVSETLHRGSVP